MARKRGKDRNRNGPTASTAERMEPAAATPPPQAAAAAVRWPPLYRNPKPLHLRDHADLALKTPFTFGFAAKMSVVPIVLGEFLAACRDYPVVFTAENPPVPVAVVGLRRNENLFVNGQGRWDPTAYIPAYLRRYPFLLVEAGEPRRRILFVDEDAPQIVRGEDLRLIENGQPSEAAKTAVRFCEAFLADQERTLEFTSALAERGMLEPRTITLTLGTGQKMQLRDVRIIASQKFEQLPEDVLLDWWRRKWLFPALCEIQSLVNWQRLAFRIRRPRT